MKQQEVSAEQISILKSLFDSALGKDTETKYPDYIYSAFKSYVEQKTHIKLDLYRLEDCDEELRTLIMHQVETGNERRGKGDLSNTLRAETQQIFPNIKIITIDTGTISQFTLSLWSLLALIGPTAIEKVSIIGRAWLDSVKRLPATWPAIKAAYVNRDIIYGLDIGRYD